MRVVVTGGTGFVGRHLVSALVDAGVQVVSLVRRGGDVSGRAGLRIVDVDLGDARGLDALDLGRSDILFHLAAWTPKQSGPQDVDAIVRSNVLGTDQLLRALLPRVDRVVFASSIDVYGTLEGRVGDAAPTTPTTIYGAGKLIAESIVRQRAAEAGRSWCVLRLGHIYGPGEAAYRKLVPLTIERVLRGELPLTLGDGLERRDLLYVADAVAALSSAARSTATGPFNLVSGVSYTVRDIVGTIEDIAGASQRAAFGEPRHGPPPVLDFDTTQIRQALDFQPRTALRDGLAREIENVRAYSSAPTESAGI